MAFKPHSDIFTSTTYISGIGKMLNLTRGDKCIQLVPPFQTRAIISARRLNIIDCERLILANCCLKQGELIKGRIFHFHYGLNLDLAHHRMLR